MSPRMVGVAMRLSRRRSAEVMSAVAGMEALGFSVMNARKAATGQAGTSD